MTRVKTFGRGFFKFAHRLPSWSFMSSTMLTGGRIANKARRLLLLTGSYFASPKQTTLETGEAGNHPVLAKPSLAAIDG